MTCDRSSHWLIPNCSRMIAAFDDLELLVELLLQLALPLEGEVGRADDEDALDQAAQLQFADQQAGHDRLARAGVVGEQEAHPRELEQIVVNRLKLVRQRIDAADRQAEIRIELVGDAEGIGLQAEPQQRPGRHRRRGSRIGS